MRPDDRPSGFAWGLALISLALPWLGIGLGFVGVLRLARGEPYGWHLLATGGALVVLDILIDWVWAHPSISLSDAPNLNRRGAQLVGQVLPVAEAIVDGRGEVKVGDTLWPAAGPDCSQGARVRVTGVDGTVLVVEKV